MRMGPRGTIALSAADAADFLFSGRMQFQREGHQTRWVVDYMTAALGNPFLVEAQGGDPVMASYGARVMSALAIAPPLGDDYTGVLVVVAQSTDWALVATSGSMIGTSRPLVYYVDRTTIGRGGIILLKAMSLFTGKNVMNGSTALEVAQEPWSLPLWFRLHLGRILNPLYLNDNESKLEVAIGKAAGSTRALCAVRGLPLGHSRLPVRRLKPKGEEDASHSDEEAGITVRGGAWYPPPQKPMSRDTRRKRMCGPDTRVMLLLLEYEILALGLKVDEITNKAMPGRPGKWMKVQHRDDNIEAALTQGYFQSGQLKIRAPTREEAKIYCRTQYEQTVSMKEWAGVVTAKHSITMLPLEIGPGAEAAMRELSSFKLRVDSSKDCEAHLPNDTDLGVDIDQYIHLAKNPFRPFVPPEADADEAAGGYPGLPEGAGGPEKSAYFDQLEAQLRPIVNDIESKGFVNRHKLFESSIGRLKSVMVGAAVPSDAIAAVIHAQGVLNNTMHEDQLWYMDSDLRDVRYYDPNKKGKFETFNAELKGANKWVSLGLGRSEGGEPLDVLIVAPNDVEGCRRAVFDVVAAIMVVLDTPSDPAKRAASRNGFGKCTQAVHGSQHLVKLAAVYLIVERQKVALTYNATEFRLAFRVFNNKWRGLNANFVIPGGDLRSFSPGVVGGKERLREACVAASIRLFERAQARSIIRTLESEFPAKMVYTLKRNLRKPRFV
jgi:hypothetical protein